MSANLRKRTDESGELYVNVMDLLKLMVDLVRVDGMHPEAIKAIDGLGTGLALSLGVVSIEELPDSTQKIIEMRNRDELRGNLQAGN